MEALTYALTNGYTNLVRPILFQFTPEAIHDWMIATLQRVPRPVWSLVAALLAADPSPVEVAGIRFGGRVGLAAGLDKSGVCARAWAPMGFAFAELGTVTAHAQPGNPTPRVFRLPHSGGLINRMGFNNPGASTVAQTLAGLGVKRGNNALGAPLGVSIGKTKRTPLDQAVPDYLMSLDAIAPFADYVAINVSSPNTPGLRGLQERGELSELATALVARAKELYAPDPVPLFVKVSPDLSGVQLAELIEVCEDAGISGLIATNTTLGRGGVSPADEHLTNQAGGLSGAPLQPLALRCLEAITARTTLPVMASGGIMTPADAQAAFNAGAVLVQVYTGFIYNGPGLVRGINRLTVPQRLHQVPRP